MISLRLLALTVSVASVALIAPAHAEPAPPNVVIIYADDLGPGDLGHYHRERTGKPALVETPRMDALIAEGMRFIDAHASTALCSPSRYCAMTGNLCHRSKNRWGVWRSNAPTPIADNDATLGRIGQDAGLTTGFIGKYHLGGAFKNPNGQGFFRGDMRNAGPDRFDGSALVDSGPQSIGFDYSFTMPAGIQGPLYTAYENGQWYPFSEDSKLINLTKATALEPAIVSDKGPGLGDSHFNTREVGPLLAGKAVDFIDSNAEQDQPFLLCYWSPMVHIPHLPPDSFNGRPIAGQHATRHLDMVAEFDQQVGAIVDALKAQGVYDNTIIFLLSDNGGLRDGKAEKLWHDSSNGWRGSKNSPHEGGRRIPFVVVWPGHIEPGTTSFHMTADRDIVATLADLFKTPLREDQGMDALSLLPVLLGQAEDNRERMLPLQGGSHNELIHRVGPWKLIIDSNHPETEHNLVALFNLDDNPKELEEQNLLNNPAHADRVQSMFNEYMEWRKSGARSTPAMQSPAE
ncbi:MAG: sulfatase-like hydrolase/transferase [Planctomycetota bacterium]